MLAKKESFLKYLKDEFTPNIKLKKINSNIKSKDTKSIIENKNDIILPPNINNNKDDYSFQNFVNKIKNYDFNKKIKWESQIHKSSLSSDNNSHKIKLMELNRINYINPILILHKDYLKLNYNIDLFQQELIHIEDKLKISNNNDKSNKKYKNILENSEMFIENLINERERFELNKKIINYYMMYYCENNIEKIFPSIKDIEKMNENINLYYEKIHKGKQKISELKKFNIDNTMKMILKKKKYENMIKIYCFIKNNIFKYYKDIKRLKLKNMNFDYINYYNEMNKLINNIELLENNENVNNISKNQKMKFIEGFKNKLMKKKEKFTNKYNSEISKLFDSKKSNIMQLYYLFNIENSINDNPKNDLSNLFVSKMVKNFKIRSKKLILETLNYYRKKEKTNSNSITIMNLTNQKLSEINNIQIPDYNIIPCFKHIFSKLKTHIDNFFFYFNLISENNESSTLKKEIISRKYEFYEIIDKHLSKLLKLLYNPKEKSKEEKILPKKIFLKLINILCLFGKLLQYKYDVNYSKYLNLGLKNCILNQIKLENKYTLNRAFILLKNDYWEKTILDKSYLNINNLKEKAPLYLKKFISFLNEDNINNIDEDINKNNLEIIFNNIINNNDNNNNNLYDINFDEITDLDNNKNGIKIVDKNNEIKILNKPLKYNSLFINNSSMCILRGIEEQICNLIIFEFLTYEIFLYLFNSIDLYIYICFKIFLNDNKYLSNLIKNINFSDIQNNLDNINYWNDFISFQEKYSLLKKFIISTEKKFCEHNGHTKKFINEEEKQNFINNLIPKLKDILIISNTDNNFLPNNINQNKESNKSLNNNNINSDTKNDAKDKGFLGILRSAVDDIGDGISKAKDTAKILLKNNQNNKNEALIQEIKQKLVNNHFKQILIFISCISSFYKILKRLVDFTTKIELDFQKNQITEKISKYKILIEQINYFISMKISYNLINSEKISNLIQELDWAPPPEEGASQLFEASLWVSKIINIFEVIVDEIYIEFNSIFGDKKLVKFFGYLIKYIINSIQDNFAKIKICNDTGRSIMLKDIKFLKQGIEKTLKKYNYDKRIKTDELFDIIMQYINAWYYTTDEINKFISDNNLEYKYFESFLHSSPMIINLPQEKKNAFINSIKQKYLLNFKKVLAKLKK